MKKVNAIFSHSGLFSNDMFLEDQLDELISRNTNRLSFFGGFNENTSELEKIKNEVEKEFFDAAADSPKLFELQTKNGINIGMFACRFELKKLAKEAAKYPSTLKQKDNNNKTFADYLKKFTSWDIAEIAGSQYKNSNEIIDDLHKEMLGF